MSFSAISTCGSDIMTGRKDTDRKMIGRIAKAKGKQFEERLDSAFQYYRKKGTAIVEKTPEPMCPVKNIGNGKFIAYFEKKAQPDYKGTLKGGMTIVCEAKFTATDRMEQGRVKRNQAEYMDMYQNIGALCYILAGFSSGSVYRIPWGMWSDMKEFFGRMYVTEADLDVCRVKTARNGTLLLLE